MARPKKRQWPGGREPTRAWIRWRRECDNLTRLLKELRESKALGGEKWRESMKRHYNQRLKELRKNEPPKFGDA